MSEWIGQARRVRALVDINTCAGPYINYNKVTYLNYNMSSDVRTRIGRVRSSAKEKREGRRDPLRKP